MKYIKHFVLVLTGTLIFAGSSCNDPTVIGSDLLDEDLVDLAFTDTLTINTYTATVDSIATYNPNTSINIESFPVGIFNDPIFGRSSSEVYFQVTLNVNFPTFDPFLHTLDSVVLVIPYDADLSYGNFDEQYELEVYQIAEPFPDSLLYSNQTFQEEQLIGSIAYTPAVEDSITIFSPKDDSTFSLPPQLRIPLDQGGFANSLFTMDSLQANSVPDFEDFIKGLYLKPTSENNALPVFQFRSSTTGLRVYYHTKSDTTYLEYFFPLFSGNVVTAHYEHDYSTSSIDLEGEYIGENAIYRDSLLFLQGMSGVNVMIEIPYATELKDLIVNKAELEIPLVSLMGDQMEFTPIESIFISEVSEDGTLRVINDISYAINRVGIDRFDELFGGVVESDDIYRLNISSHFQDMIRGLVTNKLVLTAFPKAEQPTRVVLRGPKNSEGSLKLNLTFTNY